MIQITLITNSGRKTINVSEDATVREVLDENRVNYSVGMTQIDGCSLRPGDLDKTFAQHGIEDACYLSVVVKADNAATVTVIGEAAVVTSALKLEDIQLAKKYRPEALKLYKDDKKNEQLFGIDVTTRSSGSINDKGATFSEATNQEGYATITMCVDRDDDIEAQLTDKIGMGLLYLNKIEENFADAVASIHADQEKIKGFITIQ
jgi:archaellin